ncbi:hypothetical protein QBC38DRAFT_98137 [Podospora fimiseda]|uniref:Uncharacterized protein n=1 Tax=Podospora fimiseda TaxID=252190 RepID=A0AAN7H6F2_9PEZI|nr:hypothetical protein QBC38DRAFT_98137 [Podospora fimiseda]
MPGQPKRSVGGSQNSHQAPSDINAPSKRVHEPTYQAPTIQNNWQQEASGDVDLQGNPEAQLSQYEILCHITRVLNCRWPLGCFKPCVYASSEYPKPEPTELLPRWDGAPETFYQFLRLLVHVYNCDAPFGYLGQNAETVFYTILDMIPSSRFSELSGFISASTPDSDEAPLLLMDALVYRYGNHSVNNRTGHLITAVPRVGEISENVGNIFECIRRALMSEDTPGRRPAPEPKEE